MDNPKVYLAGPFFNPSQVKVIDDIADLLKKNNMEGTGIGIYVVIIIGSIIGLWIIFLYRMTLRSCGVSFSFMSSLAVSPRLRGCRIPMI